MKPLFKTVLSHHVWLLVGLTVLVVFAIRVRLREMPLERDEGEYAYVGQLILHGVAPYKEASNMKLPGTYVGYALIMAVFGQTPAAIHLGLSFINAATVVLIFLLGRKILDDAAGVTAAVVYALLSTSPAVAGLAAHANHFVVLAAVAGMLVLLKGLDEIASVLGDKVDGRGGRAALPRDSQNDPSLFWPRGIFLSGLLFGLAFLMKQQGVFFGVCGFLYLAWRLAAAAMRGRKPRSRSQPRPQSIAGRSLRCLVAFCVGCLLPYGLTCLILLLAGVFPRFWFWTVLYASKYASIVPIAYGSDSLKVALQGVMGPNTLFWILPWFGALVMWWEDRLSPNYRLLLVLFLACSFASTCVGFYFRSQYFITLLPALALLAGVAISRAVYVLLYDRTIELFLAVAAALCFALAVPWTLIGNGGVWFAMSPESAEQAVYNSSMNQQAARLAAFIRKNTPPEARIAVVGSEPEIYFLCRRRSASTYLYSYPLMEYQPYAATMQEQMAAEIETNKPEYVVYVQDDLSWLTRPASKLWIFDWWKKYWTTNLDLVEAANILERHERSWVGAAPELTQAFNIDGTAKRLLLLERRGRSQSSPKPSP